MTDEHPDSDRKRRWATEFGWELHRLRAELALYAESVATADETADSTAVHVRSTRSLVLLDQLWPEEASSRWKANLEANIQQTAACQENADLLAGWAQHHQYCQDVHSLGGEAYRRETDMQFGRLIDLLPPWLERSAQLVESVSIADDLGDLSARGAFRQYVTGPGGPYGWLEGVPDATRDLGEPIINWLRSGWQFGQAWWECWCPSYGTWQDGLPKSFAGLEDHLQKGCMPGDAVSWQTLAQRYWRTRIQNAVGDTAGDRADEQTEWIGPGRWCEFLCAWTEGAYGDFLDRRFPVKEAVITRETPGFDQLTDLQKRLYCFFQEYNTDTSRTERLSLRVAVKEYAQYFRKFYPDQKVDIRNRTTMSEEIRKIESLLGAKLPGRESTMRRSEVQLQDWDGQVDPETE